ncbi:MAG: SusC/RagA family TonB-linked outer membrane protein [Clostridium sp.]|nr:SusC/RagA family TonB-linked outer membrane protein [Prevotella sp.]MCM1378122.1 SusC/RagA family TonB-linked outer membrane protein [Prevotella sp.]MCM1428944.1 SusC/RagA family TonB-linked outer membrane protein [Clostridium sp.]MCM1475978.1 SusC/RagA family TonB-linked outer membrane protein [Muribaculaceae bacterium]
MRKLFLILMTLMACTWGLQAQTRTIHGTVLDAANNEPLIGATVMPIGGGQGAAADLDGNFTINVPANVHKATVSYVGYTSKTVDLTNGMTVYLSSSSTNLDDVVVVAYGTANKESLTGSVAVVGAKEIEDRPVISVTSALEGNAPGVQVNSSVGQPGASPSIRIRGFNSINGTSSPLYVVDGVPYVGSISDLNPADIESMTVLKDAASCALYGNRGANGVILITTKKAKNVGKVDVTLQIRQGMYNRGLPFYDRLDVKDWTQTMFNSRVVTLMQNENFEGTREDAINSVRNGFFNQKIPNIFGVANAEVFNELGQMVVDGPQAGYNDLDWWPILSQNGYRQEYNVNAAAATEKYNIFASVGYLKSNGYMLMTDFERFNGRINANFEPVSYFRFGVNLSAVAQEQQSNGAGAGAGMINNPFAAQFYAPTYAYYKHDADGAIVRDSNGTPVWNDALYLQGENVAQSLRLNRTNNSATVIDGSIYGTAVIPYGFELTVRGNMHRDKTNAMNYVNNQTGTGINYNGMLSTSYGDYRSHTFMQQLNWSHEYGDHHVDVLLDHENYYYKENESSLSVSDQVFDGMYDLSNFQYTYPAAQTIGEIASESYLGRVRYNYNQKYFGEVSLRRDGSSYFSKKHRWGTFWSVGASWIITKEKFMQDINWINYLKLRAAYGSVGQDATAGAYSYYSLYAVKTYGGLNTYIPGSIASDDIKWEATKTLDVALEGSLFNDRFNFTVGYFNKRNSDLLYRVTRPASVGTIGNSGYNPSVLMNVGTMQNIGWELQFGVDIIRNREFTWSASIDATFMKNKILNLPNGRSIPGQSLFIGKSIYEKYTYEWAGVDQLTGNSLYVMDPSSPDYWVYAADGKTLDAKATQAAYDKQVEEAKKNDAYVVINGKEYTTNTTYAGRRIMGTAIPTVYGSFGTTLAWKGINLGILFTYSLGGKTYDSNYETLTNFDATSIGALHKDALNAWTGAPEGMTADSPNRIDPNGFPSGNTERNMNNHAGSSRFLISSNYLTLKNINLSYDLPKNWVSAIKLQNINVGLSIDDLFIITRRKGLTPGSFNGTVSQTYVPARVFSFQLSARF